jgi:hypothetical protein
MAFAIADRVQETTTTQGTGTVLLSGAVVGYQSFAAVGDGNTTYYTIADQSGANWEVGIGTYYLANTSLARTTILASSNSNAAVSLGLGTKVVFVTYPAEKAIYSDDNNVTTITNFASANVLITGGSISNVSISNATYSGLGTMSTQNANSVAITGGTINNVSLSNVTYGGLGTMSTQNANNVAITGGTIDGVSLSNVTYGGLGTMSTQDANAVAITGGNATVTTLNATTGNVVSFVSSNVAITGGTIDGVSLSNVTYGGLGTMSTQDANSVAISGGTINGLTNVSTANLIATGGTVNGVIIGGTTPANASFTNVAVSNQLIANASAGASGQVLTSGGANVSPYWANTASAGLTGLSNASILNLNVNLTADATINAGVNGFSVGPVNTANGVVITITSGQRWVII